MSSLGIFNKETKTYQKVAGTAEAAVVDAEMSDTSTNTVQNKVIKKYVDDKQVNIDGITLTIDEAKNVIKLADALKDKIGSALQPESIVNNQITTVEGFALDARQANPNIDGSLAKQISDLNGSLNDKFSQQSLISNLSDVKDIGIYYIHNSSEMPSTNGWYIILSFARQDGSTIPMIAMDQFSDNVYYGRLYKGNNGYQLTSWNKL